jgi:hypothetical protein
LHKQDDEEFSDVYWSPAIAAGAQGRSSASPFVRHDDAALTETKLRCRYAGNTVCRISTVLAFDLKWYLAFAAGDGKICTVVEAPGDNVPEVVIAESQARTDMEKLNVELLELGSA